MLVCIPLTIRLLPRPVGPDEVRDTLSRHYERERFVRVLPASQDQSSVSPLDCNGTNRIDLLVFGHEDQVMVLARLDNLGKGAAGAAVQSLNLMIGADEQSGLS
jgi:N-acetyl-gamma-glutamyl-phosphate reductase